MTLNQFRNLRHGNAFTYKGKTYVVQGKQDGRVYAAQSPISGPNTQCFDWRDVALMDMLPTGRQIMDMARVAVVSAILGELLDQGLCPGEWKEVETKNAAKAQEGMAMGEVTRRDGSDDAPKNEPLTFEQFKALKPGQRVLKKSPMHAAMEFEVRKGWDGKCLVCNFRGDIRPLPYNSMMVYRLVEHRGSIWKEETRFELNSHSDLVLRKQGHTCEVRIVSNRGSEILKVLDLNSSHHCGIAIALGLAEAS